MCPPTPGSHDPEGHQQVGLLMECWPVIHPARSLPVWISWPPFLPQPSMWKFHGSYGCGVQGRLPEVKSSAQPTPFILGARRPKGGQGTSQGQASGPHSNCGDSEGVSRGLSGLPGKVRMSLRLSGPPFLLLLKLGEPACQICPES